MPRISACVMRHPGGLAALTVLLVIPGYLIAQAPTLNKEVPPMLPLKQVAYIKASNAEAYDHFACGGGNQGHTGDTPLLLQPRLDLVFLSTRRTVSSETVGTTSSSTSRSASSCMVHSRRPSGGAEQAKAMRWASARPSRVRWRLGRSWGLRPKAVSSPCSPK